MSQMWRAFAAGCYLLTSMGILSVTCGAQSQEQRDDLKHTKADDAKSEAASLGESSSKMQKQDTSGIGVGGGNTLGLPFVKNLFSDQAAIWASPTHLRWEDATWLLPFAEVSGGFLAADRSAIRALPGSPSTQKQFRSLSDAGLASFVGAGGGLYLWSKVSHDEHQRETGVLAAEAMIDSLVVNSTLQYSFGRQRPYQDQGRATFFEGGNSFPSDHSAMAWSAASVIAHEYPGPLTQFLAYGMATAVSASRVMGKQHFPSDVVVSAGIGWLIGREVYKKHHDPDVGGGGWGSLSSDDERDGHRDHTKMGSPFVPLDSWVYPALERLAALGFVNTSISGLKPWTRIECARLAEEAGEVLQQSEVSNESAAGLQARLQLEFSYEFGLLEGATNRTANVKSVYARTVSISGPALTDSYHFGQTVSYDFGRPFERGTNFQGGGSFSASAGPVTLYMRAEYQHAPSAPAPSEAGVNAIALRDLVPVSEVGAGPVQAIDRPRLLDAYLGLNLGRWEIVVGKQSLSWSPGPGDSMFWSNNIEPVNMVRLVNPEPFTLPGFLRFLGPVRVDQFFGRLEGHPYVRRPFIYGEKLNIKPFSWLELGFGRTDTIGGVGGDPITATNLLHSFVGLVKPGTGSVPGDSHSGMDWTFYVPHVRNYIVLYGDSYADDDFLPIENPARNPWHPGIYITRFPGISKLDLHVEGVSTEAPGRFGGGNQGEFVYWNQTYTDGYTNGGNLIGNTVGRDGRTIQTWLTYWISPRNTLQFNYKHSTVSSDFIPGGGAWQDYSVRNETHLRSGFYVKSEIQFEHIARYPILFTGARNNVTATVEMGFSPRIGKQK
jgi:Capsule assembly protein Wzi/PAP2 superfamily